MTRSNGSKVCRRVRRRSRPGWRKATDRPEGGAKGDEEEAAKRRRGLGASKLSIARTETLAVEAQAGSRFKGYEEITVQDLALKVEATLYRRERWQTPDGKTLTAPLPAGIVGGCGPHLHRLVLGLHFQGQMTYDRIVALLTGLGFSNCYRLSACGPAQRVGAQRLRAMLPAALRVQWPPSLGDEASQSRYRRERRHPRGDRPDRGADPRQLARRRILLRADLGFAREALMAWCGANRVDCLSGLARNTRLAAMIESELVAASSAAEASGKPARHFKEFRWSTLDSWSRERRVIAKAEWTQGEANPRFIVTSLSKEEADGQRGAKYTRRSVWRRRSSASAASQASACAPSAVARRCSTREPRTTCSNVTSAGEESPAAAAGSAVNGGGSKLLEAGPQLKLIFGEISPSLRHPSVQDLTTD